MDNSNRYTNSVRAAAYSLGVDIDLLQQALEPLRIATERKREIEKKPTLENRRELDAVYQFVIQINTR